MKRLLQLAGRIAHWCAWPAYWVYFRRSIPRTRVIVEHDGKILMVRQWIGDGRWQLPGGGLYSGEDPASGAARELLEETNIKLPQDKLKLLGKGSQRNRGLTFDYYAFYVRVQSADFKKQNIELSDAMWLTTDALNSTNTRPETLASIQMLK